MRFALLLCVPAVALAADHPTELSNEQIARVISSHALPFRDCYVESFKADPSIGGSVRIDYTIAKGIVTSATVDPSSTMSSGTVKECVRSAFQKLTFPLAGAPAKGVYPFLFQAGS